MLHLRRRKRAVRAAVFLPPWPFLFFDKVNGDLAVIARNCGTARHACRGLARGQQVRQMFADLSNVHAARRAHFLRSQS